MKAVAAFLLRRIGTLRGVTNLALSISLVSCSSNKQGGEYGSGYASYPDDGRYHPYNKSGSQPPSAQGSSSHYQEYTPPPDSGRVAGCESQPDSSSDSLHPSKKKKTKPSAKVASSDNDDSSSDTPKPRSTKSKSKSSSAPHGTFTHTVKHTDTMYGLAKKYHTTVNTIKRVNGRSTDVLRDGEKIKIPKSAED